MKTSEWFFLSIRFNLGKGEQGVFWHDLWAGDVPPKMKFSRAFLFSKNPTLSAVSNLKEVPTDAFSNPLLNTRLYAELSKL